MKWAICVNPDVLLYQRFVIFSNRLVWLGAVCCVSMQAEQENFTLLVSAQRI